MWRGRFGSRGGSQRPSGSLQRFGSVHGGSVPGGSVSVVRFGSVPEPS